MKKIKYLGQAMAAMALAMAMTVTTFAAEPAESTAVVSEADGSGDVDVSGITIDNASASQTEQVRGFVERLYTLVLGRSSDASGLDSWTNVLISGKEDGAKVALGFVDSVEFKSRNLSDTDYITVLYRTFLNREPDPSGLAAWQNVLANGFSRTYVFRGFAESTEFQGICDSYGIKSGTVTLNEARDQKDGITRFVNRAYKLCLGRSADVDGLNGWCNALLTGKNTAKETAYGFVFSNEFKSKNLSDEDYVKTMYNMFFDREPDTDGYNAWVKVLKNGGTREHVFDGFADSVEFQKLYASFLDGSYVPKNNTTDSTTDQKKDEQTTTDPSKDDKKDESSSKDTTSETTHTHNWEAVTETVHHDAVTEQVWVVDQEAWDEEVWSDRCVCNKCGKYMYTQEDLDHIHECKSSYHSESYLKEVIHHDEVGHYETKTVTEAYDEVKTVGRKCTSCGVTEND